MWFGGIELRICDFIGVVWGIKFVCCLVGEDLWGWFVEEYCESWFLLVFWFFLVNVGVVFGYGVCRWRIVRLEEYRLNWMSIL